MANSNDPRWKIAAENDPLLDKMATSCENNLDVLSKTYVKMKASKAGKGSPNTVVPTAMKDIKLAIKALEKLVGKDTPYMWDVIDLDKE